MINKNCLQRHCESELEQELGISIILLLWPCLQTSLLKVGYIFTVFLIAEA